MWTIFDFSFDLYARPILHNIFQPEKKKSAKKIDKPKLPLSKYEIIIKYNTGDRIEASFKDKKDCMAFLETYK
jgi:hypothetical protein